MRAFSEALDAWLASPFTKAALISLLAGALVAIVWATVKFEQWKVGFEREVVRRHELDIQRARLRLERERLALLGREIELAYGYHVREVERIIRK